MALGPSALARGARGARGRSALMQSPCRCPRSRCTCRSRWPTTSTSTARSSTPPTSAGSSVPTGRRCCPTGGTCRSATTVAPARSWSRAPTCSGPPASGRRPTRRRPTFGPSRRLDIEAELGFVVGAPTPMGRPVPTAAFAEHVFGVTPLNDWSARDIQAWEYVPLGPFLGKSFATSISAWITPLQALERRPYAAAGTGPRSPGVPAGRRARRLRHRLRGGAQRRGGEPAAVRRDVLVPRPDARPHDVQRRLAAHRRPLRQRHDQRRRARPARLVPGAQLGRQGAVRGRPDLPRGRRRGDAAGHRSRRARRPDRAGRGHRPGPARRARAAAARPARPSPGAWAAGRSAAGTPAASPPSTASSRGSAGCRAPYAAPRPGRSRRSGRSPG